MSSGKRLPVQPLVTPEELSLPRQSSPSSSSSSSWSPESSDNETLVSTYEAHHKKTSLSMLEAGRAGEYGYDDPILGGSGGGGGGGSGPWGRARARIGGRTGMRRMLALIVFLSAAMLIYRHDQYSISAAGSTRTTPSSPAAADDVNAPQRKPQRPPLRPPALDFSPSDQDLPTPKDYSPYYGGSSQRPIDIASDPLDIEATLKERLEVWGNAPGGRGEVEGEVEMGGFHQWNLEECSTISQQHGDFMLKEYTNQWMSFNRSSIHELREELITYMESLIGTSALSSYGKKGRGIVMVAGNEDTLQRAVWSVQLMRKRGATMPVQIFQFPSEAPEADDPIRETLKELDIELVAVEGQQKDAKRKKSYHLKAAAMIGCTFEEVLYLDSDSIPATDPEYMFDAPSYTRLGVWTAPDYWKTSASNPIWALMGVKCRNEWEMEAGQIYIDKRRHLDVLHLSKYMLERHERFYQFSDGDKDVFRWAMLALRKRWGVPGRWVGGGALPSDSATGFCAHTMMQHDAWGEPLFVHYNLLKQIPSGIGLGFTWGRTKQMPLFNTWPATSATARLGEPMTQPNDTQARGLGDIDCDMLADTDEYGIARAPAKEMIMRRAARERGAKAKYHGGVVSALCIDFDYVDVRPADRREVDERRQKEEEDEDRVLNQAWLAAAAAAIEKGEPEPPRPNLTREGPVLPDWRESPFEVVSWEDDKNLNPFERDVYNLGFKAFSSF